MKKVTRKMKNNKIGNEKVEQYVNLNEKKIFIQNKNKKP